VISKHLHKFINEYENADHGFVICRTERPFKLSDTVTAIPWQQIDRLIAQEVNL